jgi:hypothetical protein
LLPLRCQPQRIMPFFFDAAIAAAIDARQLFAADFLRFFFFFFPYCFFRRFSAFHAFAVFVFRYYFDIAIYATRADISHFTISRFQLPPPMPPT